MPLPAPPDFHALMVRTDFTDDACWASVCDLVESFNCEGYTPTLLRMEDPAYDGATVKDLTAGSGPRGRPRPGVWAAGTLVPHDPR